jgi:hypothetical protein
MQQLLRVLAAIIVAAYVALAAAPAQAADGVVLVGCNLFSAGGPTVTFVQAGEVSGTTGAFGPGGFVGITGPGAEDFPNRACAEVLSVLIDAGLTFQAVEVFGRDSSQALWFLRQE